MTTCDPQLLEKYAELAINVGVNVRKGQRLLIARAPLQLAPLVHLLTKHAYLAGARLVEVEWLDLEVDRLRLQYAPADTLSEYPDWRADLHLDYYEKGDATLALVGNDPDKMAGSDPEALAVVNKARAQKMAPVFAQISSGASNWSIIAGATAEWAAKMFPQLTAQEAESKLWNAIFAICRVECDDPAAAWQDHIKQMKAREEYLNAGAYWRLRLRAPGTDLTMGLPEGHQWLSGGGTARNGVYFIPNIPTEEVFTMPHRERVEGIVSSTKPLSYNNSLINDFQLTFEKGRVVNAVAAQGQAALDALLAVDEGARSLGEIALVPHSSPISASNLLFYNTLYDENASSHLALGSAYRYSLRDSADMSPEAFSEAGGNYSLAHVDFMVGSADMDIDGYLTDGSVEPLMRGGEWAFDV